MILAHLTDCTQIHLIVILKVGTEYERTTYIKVRHREYTVPVLVNIIDRRMYTGWICEGTDAFKQVLLWRKGYTDYIVL